jgi:hypothetical protein
MKLIQLALMSSLLFSSTVFASETKSNSIEESAINEDSSPKALVEIESRIEILKLELLEKLKTANGGESLEEGKIIASIIMMVEDNLKLAEEELNKISSDNNLTVKNITSINTLLDQTEELIASI